MSDRSDFERLDPPFQVFLVFLKVVPSSQSGTTGCLPSLLVGHLLLFPYDGPAGLNVSIVSPTPTHAVSSRSQLGALPFLYIGMKLPPLCPIGALLFLVFQSPFFIRFSGLSVALFFLPICQTMHRHPRCLFPPPSFSASLSGCLSFSIFLVYLGKSLASFF